MAGMETQSSSRVLRSISYNRVEIRIKEGERGKRKNFQRYLSLHFSALAKHLLPMWSFFSSSRFSNQSFASS